jgi:hypothetical protein
LSGTVLTKTGEMSMKRYVVNLEKEEKEHLEQITSKDTTGAASFSYRWYKYF